MKSAKEKYNWDVFISYASEDKEGIAFPLANLLAKSGLKVWIDKHEIFIGDSLRRKIDEGLLNSKFGVVILSKFFFKKEWPKKELDALVSREDGREKVILPIWHNVTKSFISQHSPLLADKVAVSSEKGLEVVANKILEVVNKEYIRQGVFFSKRDINSLLDAIYYYQFRTGPLSSKDPLFSILGKLKEAKSGIKMERFNSVELNLLLKTIDENIAFLNKYEYKGLSLENANNNRQEILMPLFELRKSILIINQS
jgi:hypothetical protein